MPTAVDVAGADRELAVATLRLLLPAGVDDAAVQRAVQQALDAPTPMSPSGREDRHRAEFDAALGSAPDVVLCVDPIDHGRPADVVLAAHHVVVTREPDARLIMAGVETPEGAQVVERYLSATRLDTVWRTHAREAERRDALVARSRILVAWSSSPSTWSTVRRALASGTPVVALDAGALGLLVGDAALVLPSDSGPLLLAEAVTRILRDRRLHGELAERGLERSAATQALDAVPLALRALHRELVR